MIQDMNQGKDQVRDEWQTMKAQGKEGDQGVHLPEHEATGNTQKCIGQLSQIYEEIYSYFTKSNNFELHT